MQQELTVTHLFKYTKERIHKKFQSGMKWEVLPHEKLGQIPPPDPTLVI
jgi:hypothetical protein